MSLISDDLFQVRDHVHAAPGRGSPSMVLTGFAEAAKAPLLALLLHQPARPVVIVTAQEEQAARLADDLQALLMLQTAGRPDSLPVVQRLPARTADDLTSYPRVAALLALLEEPAACVVTTPAALRRPSASRQWLRSSLITLETGSKIDRDALLRRFVDLGYQPAVNVDQLGQFAARGGVIDYFDPSGGTPVRVELAPGEAADRIESLRTFDPATQTSLAHLPRARITPAHELIPDEEPTTNYLPPDTLLILDEPSLLIRETDEPGQAAPPLSWPAVLDATRGLSRLALASLGLDATDGGPAAATIRVVATALQAEGLAVAGTPWTATLERLKSLAAEQRVLVLAHSHPQQQRLLELLHEEGLTADRWAPRPLLHPDPPRGLWVAVGALSAGCRLREAGWWLLTEEELFGKTARERPLKPSRRAKLAAMLSSMEELKLDGYVVHLRHGIGRYQGLKRLSIGGFDSDFLELLYAGGDKVYVPLDRLDLVQKYIGVEGSHPRLDRLGGTAWVRATKRAKKAVEKLAKDLLDLYAVRSIAAAHACSADGPEARAFAAGFEYEETPDQLRAIDEVGRALERPHPMDLLVCGDVGYGKTEVAMRAAFKAVMDGKQVAVLVPTTLLAQQHARTFARRFAPFPVRVEEVSRFRSSAALKEIRRELAGGNVDLVIGTHRLLQRDIQFRDLGLLIIDEEHRFGVRQKERIKTLKQSIHCLTLTATPIPRTLQMSLLGVRDLSLIETAPPDRLAVQTRLVPFDQELIRSAIRFELARGGQCFFIHNRIQELEAIGRLLAELAPEARIVMAHGQMRAAQLDAAMERFLGGRADVLLSTAIVESGLDIPHANTIIIHRADRFGLADLYQLRGRVGRSAVQAFAYLIVPDESGLSSAARARLEAIRDFTELGAGFKIAARDLEIRGAGNLLGPQQSGQIAAIGYELYLQFLEEAVRALRGEPARPAVEPTLALKLSAYLPEEYVADGHQRLAFYKRLASAPDDAALERLKAQLTDQFGSPPAEAVRLLEVMSLRLLAKRLGLQKIETTASGAALHVDPHHPLSPDGLTRLIAAAGPRLRFLDQWTITLRYPDESWASLGPLLRADLRTLLGCDTT
ncbi:MAG: transcription-repair coupling factor [Nitrospirota bacterium]